MSTLAVRTRRFRAVWASGRVRAWLTPAALTGVLGAAAAFIYTRGGDLSFYVDEWDFLLHRHGFSAATFLDAQNGHLVAFPILVYRVMFHVFGAGSYVPFRVLAIAIQLTCALLLFTIVRRRAGDLLALAAAITLLFLGPAWEPIISPDGIIALPSLAAGLGMLVALDRGSRRGDALACLLLAISLASFSYGPAFAVGAAVDILLRPGARRRMWIVVVPGVLYALWALHYEHGQLLAVDIPGAPRAIVDLIGVDLASITGLYRLPGAGGGVLFDSTYVAPLGVAAACLIGFVLARTRAWSAPRLFAAAALALTFWLEVALVLDAGRTVTSARYVYPGVALLLVLGAELLHGRRLPRRVPVAALVAAAGLAAFVQPHDLNEGAAALNNLGRFDRAELEALNLARGVAPPTFMPEPLQSPQLGFHYLEDIDAASYYAAVSTFGSPADTLDQLLRAPAGPRAAADQVLARALGIAPHPVTAPTGSSSCTRLKPTPGISGFLIQAPVGGFYLQAHQAGELKVHLRRFAPRFGPDSVALPPIQGSAPVAVPIHVDPATAKVPWQVELSGVTRTVRFCPLRPA